MGLRQKIEDNLAIWLFSALVTGFLAGVGAYQAVLQMAQLEVVSRAKLEALQAAASASGQVGKALGMPTDQVKRGRAGDQGDVGTESSKGASSISRSNLNPPPTTQDDSVQVVS